MNQREAIPLTVHYWTAIMVTIGLVGLAGLLLAVVLSALGPDRDYRPSPCRPEWPAGTICTPEDSNAR